MKFKKMKVPKFIYKDDFGIFEMQDVEILYNPILQKITPDSFDQNKDEYFLSDETIHKISHDAALRFYNQRNKEIILQKKPLSTKEVKGIKVFLGINGTDLSELIGLQKSSVSRVLSGRQPLMHDKAMLLMERLKHEIQSPGYNHIILKNLRSKIKPRHLTELKINIFSVAEYLIRIFEMRESALTNLKLQKLVYYAQGIAMGSYAVKLFKEPLLAWVHGPVVKVLYNKYKDCGKNPLPIDLNQSVEEITGNETAKKVLDETVSLYGVYDAWVLRDKTHNEPTWSETARDKVISDEKMIAFFKNQFV